MWDITKVTFDLLNKAGEIVVLSIDEHKLRAIIFVDE